jgi:enamidase
MLSLGCRVKAASHARVFTGLILLLALSACAQATPTPTVSPSATPFPAIEPTSLSLPTGTATPTATSLPESPVSFQAFPVAEGESIALINGRVIDGTGAPAWLDWTVLIQGTRIVAAGPDILIPEDARRVDLTGQTLLPGMFDMHGHLYAYNGDNLSMQYTAYPRLYLAGGVTTIFTAGDLDPGGAFTLRERIANGEEVGPHILVAGPYFSGGEAPGWMTVAQTPEKMLAYYQEWHENIDGVKVYTGIPEDQFTALLSAAHADGLFVTGHLESISGMQAIKLGIDGIEHGLFSMSEFFPKTKSASFLAQYCAISQLDVTSPDVTAIVEAIVKQGTYIDPTIVVFQPELPDFQPLVEDWEKYLDADIRLRLRSKIRVMVQPTCLHDALEKQSQFVKAIHDRGGLIVTGTDPVIPILLPGYSLHRELQNLVDAGLSPLEAIQAATLNAAIITRLDSEKGTIAAGKIADLVVVEGNPDEDITAIGNTRMVFKNGVPYLPEALRKSVEGQIGKDK